MEVVCEGEKDQNTNRIRKNIAKPKEIVTKNKSGNPDSTNSSWAHPEETLYNETLQATTRSTITAEDKRKYKPN